MTLMTPCFFSADSILPIFQCSRWDRYLGMMTAMTQVPPHDLIWH